MKKIFVISALMAICFAGAAFAATKIDSLASVSNIQGDVKVQKGGAGEWVAAKEGMFVKTGDAIKTGAKSSCVLKWGRENAMKIEPFSMMKIDRLEKSPEMRAENSDMNLWTGKVYARAQKLNNANSDFTVKTPTAIAGVRGTKLSVEVGDDDSTSVGCYDGSVYVKSNSGGEVTLKEDEKTTVKKNEPPEQPKKLEENEKKDFESQEGVSNATLDITYPEGGLETDESSIDVRGKTDAGNTVTVNGQATTADDKGAFSSTVTLTEGSNQIKIEATNKQGDAVSKTREVKYTKKPAPENGPAGNEPQSIELSVTSPRNGLVTRDSSISVVGSAKPGTDISINGTPVTMPPGGNSFNTTITLNEGENDIVVTGTKGANTQTVTQVVTKDTTPPRLIINQPGATFGVNTGGCTLMENSIQCDIIGQTEPDVMLTINGVRVNVQPDGSFQQTVTLSYDQNTIEIAALDAAGNRGTSLITRVLNRDAIGYIELSVTPSSIKADGQSQAVVTVTTLNLLKERIDVKVDLRTTTGGTLADNSLTTVGGSASTFFTAGVGSIPNTVTITATNGSVSSSTTLFLFPDKPPTPGGN